MKIMPWTSSCLTLDYAVMMSIYLFLVISVMRTVYNLYFCLVLINDHHQISTTIQSTSSASWSESHWNSWPRFESSVRITIISRAGVGGMKAEIGSDQSNNQELSFSLIRNKYYRLAALIVRFYSSSFWGLPQEQ